MDFTYNRRRSYLYARRWAYRRNPLFYNYSGIGGNCTNFVSQCIYAGCCTMNYTETFGWYYLSDSNRTASWTGVQFLYNFLTSNTGNGPYGEEAELVSLEVGDVVQLRNEDGEFYHSLIVTGRESELLLAAQTNDALDRPLSTYNFAGVRGIHILGYRAKAECKCFLPLYDGTELITCE